MDAKGGKKKTKKEKKVDLDNLKRELEMVSHEHVLTRGGAGRGVQGSEPASQKLSAPPLVLTARLRRNLVDGLA